MDQIILSNENNNLQYLCHRKTKHGYIEEDISYGSLKQYLNYLSENKQLLGPITIVGKDLIFTSDKYKIVLLDYKDFKNKKRFSFVFDELRNRKIKLYKEKFSKPVAIILATITTLSVSGKLIEGAAERLVETKKELSTDYESEERIFETDFVMPEETTAENTTITQKTTTENITIAQETKEDEKSENNELYESLCIGSACDDEKAITARNLYYSLFEKYADKYGLDVDLVCAIATQERGIHSSVVDTDGAIGIMQIQVSVWNNKTVYAYDYENNKEKAIYITLDDLRDVEKNIEVGCAIFQSYLKQMNGNVIAAIQSYNNGTGTVTNTLRKYGYSCNKTINEVLESNDLGWLDYRSSSNPGDMRYLENVLRYYTGDESNLKISHGIKK